MLPAKRKRTEAASSILTRPFRSPLHVDTELKKASSENSDDSEAQQSQVTTPAKAMQTDRPFHNLPSNHQARSIQRVQPHQHSTSPIRDIAQSRTSPRDPVYNTLQKQHSALVLQFKDLSNSLDTATQALQIAQSRRDDDLARLIKKWRTASIDAAEELFSTAKDRVNRMGGVGVWRERYMKPREESGWNEEPEIDEDDLTEEQKEQLDIARDEARKEAEKYGLHQSEPTPVVKDDDSFTIDMMLKQLNVDLDAIGFDTEAQRWVE